jgi:hypothetical protein
MRMLFNFRHFLRQTTERFPTFAVNRCLKTIENNHVKYRVDKTMNCHFFSE